MNQGRTGKLFGRKHLSPEHDTNAQARATSVSVHTSIHIPK